LDTLPRPGRKPDQAMAEGKDLAVDPLVLHTDHRPRSGASTRLAVSQSLSIARLSSGTKKLRLQGGEPRVPHSPNAP
jgi:hypothetical protein